MLVEFELNGQKFSALNGGPQFTFTEAVSIVVTCADQAEVDYYWDRLSDGGQENVCGWLKDRYGLSWQIVPAVFFDMIADPDPAKAARVTQAMFGMTKFDVAALEQAYAEAETVTGPLNRRSRGHVDRGMGSTMGASAPRRSWPGIAGIAGAALLAASGAIHLDLYLTGYRSIPTIGWLFLLQVIAAFALAAAIALTGSPLAAAAGAGFAVATLGGYLLSLWVGLFGFTEVRTTAGIVAGIIDVAAFAALAVAAAPALPHAPTLVALLPAVGAASVVALALLAAAVATPRSQPATAGPDVLEARDVGGVTLLTNASGLTLYWFAPDTAAKSACYGSCAAYWPPVTGTPSAGPGVTGRLGTITRTGGTTQATYDGHPLYTYIGDSAPGQASGNNLNLNGGLWHDVPVAG